MPHKNDLVVIRSTAVDSMFGPAPVLETEDREAYDAYLESVFATIAPLDVIEQMWARQFVDLSWTIGRYNALNQSAIKAAIPQALEESLAPLVDGPWRFGAVDVYDTQGARQPRPSLEYANDYICGKAKVIEEIHNILREANLTMKDVENRAAILAMDKLERINRLISQLEARRNALLREIERHRKTLGTDLRRAAETVDGEFSEVEPDLVMPA